MRVADLNAHAVAAYDNVVFTADAMAKLQASPESQGLSGAEAE